MKWKGLRARMCVCVCVCVCLPRVGMRRARVRACVSVYGWFVRARVHCVGETKHARTHGRTHARTHRFRSTATDTGCGRSSTGAWRVVAWRGVLRCSVAQCGAVRRGAAGCGVVRAVCGDGFTQPCSRRNSTVSTRISGYIINQTITISAILCSVCVLCACVCVVCDTRARVCRWHTGPFVTRPCRRVSAGW